jgi:hypothetical protein
VLAALAAILLAERKINEARYKVTFSSALGRSIYELTMTNGHVTKERLTIGTDMVLDRAADGRGRIRAKQLDNKLIDFECPRDQLAAVYRRDSLQHPFLQHMHDWASHVKHSKFGNPTGIHQLFIDTTGATSGKTSQKENAPSLPLTTTIFRLCTYAAGGDSRKNTTEQS